LEVLEDVEGPFATTADLVDARWPGAREFARELAPHSFGSRVLDRTVSFTKGCYTGQELVARLDARGAKVPWRLVHATGPSVDAIAAVLASTGPDGPRGVTTAVVRDGAVAALAVAHRSLGDAQYGAVSVETL
ncbi:MAG: hypothetical protein KGJ36_07600, partial [Acidobacteriota bacterium]|nr:hypothetical protein [Acidobacteriota bacterium]